MFDVYFGYHEVGGTANRPRHHQLTLMEGIFMSGTRTAPGAPGRPTKSEPKEQLSVEITIHRVFDDGLFEDLRCPAGSELWPIMQFIDRVIAKSHWLVIVPNGSTKAAMAQVSYPISSELLSKIVTDGLRARQRVVVVPDGVAAPAAAEVDRVCG
ncbi:hypothetical protein [Streptomyces sp. MZ04]|uniref:hypothetical protein n=1 Tax=Streptomyces sp. MZ04 TaxID=2559236 RepID=UPI00107E76FE|nr:hypothetical protein [Streptomyces sp. MZ04]TGB03218.1 hypothetical protein E2651_25655 [Streptomyces sp. MZ04]